tara:strand:- start:456 stop:1859 length:1404 start_codon:yes stop_codon:yes gene_type:complete
MSTSRKKREPPKVLISAQASPELTSAYARVARELAIQLSRYRQVAVLGVHGNEAHPYQLANAPHVQVHPYPWQYFSGNHINSIARALGCRIVVHIGDGWRYAGEIVNASKTIPWVVHSPIDHAPLVDVEKVLAKGIDLWAVPTLWGTHAVQKEGIASYVPHGVSTSLLEGIEMEATRTDQRFQACKSLGWPSDMLRYLAVGKNVGDRKNLPGLIRAWADAKIPDSELVVWSYPTRDASVPEAYDLLGAAQSLGVENIRFPDPYSISLGVSDKQMGQIYAASDLLVQTTKAEGFGIPIIEAQAIGIPALITRTQPFLEVAGVKRPETWLDPVVQRNPRETNARITDPLTVGIGAYDLQQLLGNAWMLTPAHDELVEKLEWFSKHHEVFQSSEWFVKRRKHARKYTWELAGKNLESLLSSPAGRDSRIGRINREISPEFNEGATAYGLQQYIEDEPDQVASLIKNSPTS